MTPLYFFLFQILLFFQGNKRMAYCPENSMASNLDILRCPFLRNINEPTNLSFSSSMPFPMPVSNRSCGGSLYLVMNRFSSSRYHMFVLTSDL